MNKELSTTIKNTMSSLEIAKLTDGEMSTLLRSLLIYTEETGMFVWKSRGIEWFTSRRACNSWNARYSGSLAGNTITSKGKSYLRIGFLGSRLLSHRVAHIYMTGRYPSLEIDHINGNGTDNRWVNLREVSHQENSKNQRFRSTNSSGIMGVHFRKSRGTWVAQIMKDGVKTCLGEYPSIEIANLERKKAEIENNYHINHGSVRPL